MLIKDLYHYLIIAISSEFDREYYLLNNQDLAKANVNPLMHYIRHGWKEGRNPSPRFDSNKYLEMYPDVKNANINPLLHYIKFGKKENRLTNFLSDEINRNNKKFSDIGDYHKNLINALEKFRKIPKRDNRVSTKKQLLEDSKSINIYVHIGQGKTGTSIIQNFLDVNRQKLLQEHGFIYPNFSSNNITIGRSHNHAIWYQSVKDNQQKLTHDLEKLIQTSIDYSAKNVILSNEAWELDAEALELFNRVLNYNPDFKFKIICYIRRIDFWIESAWKQWGLKRFDNIEEYYQTHQFVDRYQKTFIHFENWAKLIGFENIIVRPYEKQQLDKGLLHDFMKLLNIDYDAHQWEKTEKKNLASNAGFNRDVLEILHYCRDLFPSETNNQLFDLFSSLLGDEFQKKPFEPYSFLSPLQRLELINKCRAAEQKIATKFMGRENGQIFFDPLPDPDEPWQPYEGLTLKKAIPIIIQMIGENNRMINELREYVDNKPSL